MEKSLEDLERQITCAVCQEHYTDPKLLPCLHYYCKECILTLALRAGKDQPFSCPECCKDITLPEGGEEELKSAFFIHNLKAVYAKYKKALSKQAHCEMCTDSQAKAEAYCQQCDKFACENCVHMHSKMKAFFDGHEILAANEFCEKAKALTPLHPPPKKCEAHRKFLSMFCDDCRASVCQDCIHMERHKDHRTQRIDAAAEYKKKELAESLRSLREVEESVSRALEEVHHTEREVETQGDSVASTIVASFEELHKILETCKEQLLEEARRRVREKMENLKGQEKKLSIDSTEILSVINYTEQCVRHCSDEEVVSMHKEITQRIQEVEQQLGAENSLEPVEEADMEVEVDCGEALQQLCQEKAKLTSPRDYLMVDLSTSTAEVNKESKCTLSTTSTKPIKYKVKMECQLHSLCSGSQVKTSVRPDNLDKYCISFTPTVRGPHEISISVNGQPVMGSPFPVAVCIPPTELDKPVKEWGGVANPLSLAINSAGEIVVAEYGGDIVVMDKEGERLRSIQRSQHQMKFLRSVAVDSDDNIFFVGSQTNIIGKSDRYCENFQLYEIQRVEGCGLIDVAVVGDEVMVTERNNKGQILVYDRGLSYKKTIVGKGEAGLKFLSPDSQDNLYVSDADKCIQVFDDSGVFLQLFSCSESGATSTHMLHVCGEYVYVGDSSLNKTLAFTKDGRYVTSFGCYGGAHVDQDGFVYMCGFMNNKMYCY